MTSSSPYIDIIILNIFIIIIATLMSDSRCDWQKIDQHKLEMEGKLQVIFAFKYSWETPFKGSIPKKDMDIFNGICH